MYATPTVTQSFSRAIVHAVSRQGIFLPEALHHELAAQEGRSSFEFQDRLWAFIDAESQDPLIGLRVGADIQVGHLDSAGLLVMSAGTIEEALQVLLDYFPIISEGCGLTLNRELGGVALHYSPSYELFRALRTEAVMTCVVRMTAWLSGGTARPIVSFQHAAQGDHVDYRAILGTTPVFQHEHYAIQFSQDELRTPLLQGNRAMLQRLRLVADEALSALHSPQLPDKVRTMLRLDPALGRKNVADRLAISPRHLSRRLQEAGVAFKELREDVLRELACAQLERPERRLRDIAIALGFSDESAFAKAFRRWTGESPGAFRDKKR